MIVPKICLVVSVQIKQSQIEIGFLTWNDFIHGAIQKIACMTNFANHGRKTIGASSCDQKKLEANKNKISDVAFFIHDISYISDK